MKTILIRAEDKNIWERRTPLVPTDISELRGTLPARFLIQKSPKRAFPEENYAAAGAEITAKMTGGDIILGIKEIPTEKILDNKTYLFFSHTIKGQSANMPMLQQIIDGGSTLIDYERIENEQARRLIYFGNYAGHAGAIDILWLMGAHWHARGQETPFSALRQALNYSSLEDAKKHLRQIGEKIAAHGFPGTLPPVVVGILGYGNVSKGAQEVFDCLPVERVEPTNLPALFQKTTDSRKIYLVIFKEQDLVFRKEDGAFELQHYYQHPEEYLSQFEKYLPYLTLVVNAVYWEKRYPRFITWEALNRIFSATEAPRLSGISDITCDVNGSVECNLKTTDSGMPAYLCHPQTRTISDGHIGQGIVLLAVDNLPAELPVDSSIFFSRQLKQFIPNLIAADFNKPLTESGLLPALQRAVIVYRGELTKPFQYLKKFLKL
jgi:alpha-aminoadipic semialdehyde synthase